MLIFNCTKAAAEFFSTTRKGEKVTPIIAAPECAITSNRYEDTPLSQWLVHAIRLERKHVLVVMNINTRYSMIFPQMKKGDVESFISLFIERILNNMQFQALDFGIVDHSGMEIMLASFLQDHPETIFCQRGEASVQRHITDVIGRFKDTLYEEGCFPDNYEQASAFDEWINDTPRHCKNRQNCFFPDEEMLVSWLEKYYGADENMLDKTRRSFSKLRRQQLAELSPDGNEQFQDLIQRIRDAANAE